MRFGPHDSAALEDFAMELARAAGEVILPLFRADCALEDKSKPGERFDPVTAADRAGEAAIRKLIAERHPDHGVIGEEYGEDRPDADLVWVLDPIDGTRAFMSGLPLWTTLIALRHQGKPVIGLIAQPYLDEIFVGGPDGSRLHARGGGQPLKTRPCSKLTDATVMTTDHYLFDGAEAAAFQMVRSAARLARYGCDAYAYAMLALGRIDLVIESGLKVWDYEPLIPVIEGAGGVATSWLGDAIGESGQIVAAGDRRVLDEALIALKRSAR